MLRILAFVVFVLPSGCADPKQQRLDAWILAEQASGNMKTDRAPADIPVDADLLIQNFERIAFDLEDPFGERKDSDLPPPERILRKWTSDIRYKVYGKNIGASLSYPHIERFMDRLSGLTGVSVQNLRRLDPPERDELKPNLLILAGNAVEFNDQARRLPQKVARLKEGEGRGTRIMADFMKVWHPSGSPCALEIFTGNTEKKNPGEIAFALVYMRTDVVSILRDSCVEEELAQAMGLMNDHPDVRPSIFNDDQEFALLTEHDELLLRILYDDRLRAGMSPEEAMPVVRKVAHELRPGS